jgi:hypothetical protein
MTFELNPDLAQDLPPTVATILQEFVATLAATMTLESVILFGSAAEGRLRERYVVEGDHEERLEELIADATGPLRASAATSREFAGWSHARTQSCVGGAVCRTAVEPRGDLCAGCIFSRASPFCS